MDNEIAFWNWTSITGAVEDSIRELDTMSDSDTEKLVTPVWSVNMAVIVLSCITLISLILLCVLNRSQCCGSKFLTRCVSLFPICEVTTTTSPVLSDGLGQPATIYVVQVEPGPRRHRRSRGHKPPASSPPPPYDAPPPYHEVIREHDTDVVITL